MAYADTDSVRTRIRKALEYGLRTITIGNGYNLTVGDINSNLTSQERRINFPSVEVDFTREDYRNAAGQRSLGWLPKVAFIDVKWHVKDMDELQKEESKALADFEKYILNNRHLPSSTGAATVFGDTMFIGNERMGIEASSPQGLVVTHLRVTYLQAQLNPSSTVRSDTRPTLSPVPPSTVSISRRDSVREALLRNLRLITQANGYKTTFNVNQNIQSFEQMIDKVNINIIPEMENVSNDDNYGLTDNFAHKVLDYRIEANGTHIDKIVEEREKIVADIECAIMNNWNLPDSNSRATALETMLVYNESLGMDVNEPQGIMRVGIRCIYRQEITNPAKPTAS